MEFCVSLGITVLGRMCDMEIKYHNNAKKKKKL